MDIKLNSKLIEECRKRKDLSKTKFSQMLGYSSPAGYSNLISLRSIPGKKRMAKIAKVVGCKEIHLIEII